MRTQKDSEVMCREARSTEDKAYHPQTDRPCRLLSLSHRSDARTNHNERYKTEAQWGVNDRTVGPGQAKTVHRTLGSGFSYTWHRCRHEKAGCKCIRGRHHAKTQRPIGVMSWHDSRQGRDATWRNLSVSTGVLISRTCSYACDIRSRRCYARMAQTTQRGRHCRLLIYPLRCPSDARTAMAQTTRTIVICAAPTICEIAAAIMTQNWETRSLT